MAAGPAAIFAPAPASACSVSGDYRVPTNLELVEMADTILIGTVEGSLKASENSGGNEILLRPTLLLKGPMLPAEVRISGSIVDGYDAMPSDPDELHEAHPLSYIGGCVRYMFPDKAMILLFLSRDEGQLRPMTYPFSRYAEDVASPDARWAKAVRLYVEIAALPESERRAALIARQQELAAQKDDVDARAIAADIGRQLAGPNKPWNELMMEEILQPRPRQ
jgi:hypothetical protein